MQAEILLQMHPQYCSTGSPWKLLLANHSLLNLLDAGVRITCAIKEETVPLSATEATFQDLACSTYAKKLKQSPFPYSMATEEILNDLAESIAVSRVEKHGNGWV